jgi:hypothetical protein
VREAARGGRVSKTERGSPLDRSSRLIISVASPNSHLGQQSRTFGSKTELELRVCKPPGVGVSLIQDSKWKFRISAQRYPEGSGINESADEKLVMVGTQLTTTSEEGHIANHQYGRDRRQLGRYVRRPCPERRCGQCHDYRARCLSFGSRVSTGSPAARLSSSLKRELVW